MKYLTTPHKLNNIERLAPFYDGFILGNESFGTRLTHSFTVEEINEAIIKIKSLKKETFISLNQMYTDKHLELLKDFILKLKVKDITGFVCADLGTIELLKTLNLEKKAIYNPETLLTNVFDFNYLAQDHIKGAYVAKEITLNDVVAIAEQKAYQVFMVGHGHLNMFYSKRKLLHNYVDYLDSEVDYKDNYDLKLIEEKRSDSPYPVLEDKAGTHVFRSKVFSSISALPTLEKYVDYLVIDTIFKDDDYGLLIADLYQNNQLENITHIQEKYQETWDEGFLHVKTIYKRG